MVLLKPKTYGKPPSPRYFHTMIYNEQCNFVVISGGRNDLNRQSPVYNDIHILNI